MINKAGHLVGDLPNPLGTKEATGDCPPDLTKSFSAQSVEDNAELKLVHSNPPISAWGAMKLNPTQEQGVLSSASGAQKQANINSLPISDNNTFSLLPVDDYVSRKLRDVVKQEFEGSQVKSLSENSSLLFSDGKPEESLLSYLTRKVIDLAEDLIKDALESFLLRMKREAAEPTEDEHLVSLGVLKQQQQVAQRELLQTPPGIVIQSVKEFYYYSKQ